MIIICTVSLGPLPTLQDACLYFQLCALHMLMQNVPGEGFVDLAEIEDALLVLLHLCRLSLLKAFELFLQDILMPNQEAFHKYGHAAQKAVMHGPSV